MVEKINILLIEDNRVDSEIITIYLKESYEEQFELFVAENLLEGIALISDNSFDIIIIDLSLPDSNGIDTFKDVYSHASEIPIIVLTGHEDESIAINTVKLGAQDFLIKGKLNSKILKRSLDYSIERYKLLKSLSENARILEEKTEDLLREKYKLALAQKLAQIGSWEWSVKDNLFTCSEELLRILGFESDQSIITYEEFIGFVHPDDTEYVTGMIEESINKLKSFDFSHRIIKRDGTIRFLQAKGELMVDKDGKILKIIGTEQDVTEWKRKEQLEQLAMVAIKSFNAVTILDKEGKIEWVNAAFTKLTGYRLEDVKGTYGEILRVDDSTGLSTETDFYKIISNEKKPLSYENMNFSKEGRQYWVLTSLSPILNEKGELDKIISIDSDITKQKKAEQDLIIANKIAEYSLFKGSQALEELHKAKKQLEESLKVKEQFLANMSHEIRTPMNAIIGFTNLLLKQELISGNKQYLNAIKTSGENLLVIINDILDFSKLESGKISFESINFKLSQTLSIVVELMLPKAVEKNIQLTTGISNDIPDFLVGDPTRLNQILINLVGNAIKFTEEGGVHIKVSLIKESEEDVYLEFRIKDTGIGIPKTSLAKIFDGFTQASNDTTRKYGGTGLGLTITKQLIELQKGTISVESKVNEGSVFSFILKFKKMLQKNEVEILTSKDYSLKFPLDGVNVLLVEDNFFNQMLASKILENWKCHVVLAGNGNIAIDKVKEMDFDLILMDIQLPELDGYEATKFIRNNMDELKRHVPIIAMTAHAFANEIEKCMSIGMNDYISKPFDENILYGKILKILQKKENNNKEIISKIDWAYLEDIFHNDKTVILNMITVFLNKIPALIDSITVLMKAKDIRGLKAILHKIMPSIVFMGLKELEVILVEMNRCLSEDVISDQFHDHYNTLKGIWPDIIKEIEIEKTKRSD